MDNEPFGERLTEKQRLAIAESRDIRDGLMRLIEKAPAGGIFTHAETQVDFRNSLALRLQPDGPIFTVTVTYGGVMVNDR